MADEQTRNTIHILLVEDNEDDLAIAERAFAKSGVASRLHVARDGREPWISCFVAENTQTRLPPLW